MTGWHENIESGMSTEVVWQILDWQRLYTIRDMSMVTEEKLEGIIRVNNLNYTTQKQTKMLLHLNNKVNE